MSLLGKRLREERKARGLAFLQIELDTRIRANIIQSLEEGDLENLPPEPFLRGLIRSYANYLRITPQELLDLYEADTAPAPPAPLSQLRSISDAHAAVSRPEQSDQPTNSGAVAAQSPKSWVRVPEANASPPPSIPRAGAHPPPTSGEPATQSPRANSYHQPASVPEAVSPPPQDPLSRLRRRLPLAPPSAKPKNPVLPSGRDRFAAPPLTPPETLPPPERLERQPVIPKRPVPAPDQPMPTIVTSEPGLGADANVHPELVPIARSRSGWPINLSQVPRSSIILMSIAVVSGLLACGLFSFTRIAPAFLSIAAIPTATPTRLAPTAAPTSLPGTSPTSVPTIAATAPPFTPVPIVVQPTAIAAPKRTVEAGSTELNLDIDATQPITVQIGIDGVMVYNGPIAAGQSQSWSAKETLYMQVENAKGASIRFNTKTVGALVYAERTLMERQWILKGGKPIATMPVPPPTPKPGSGQPAISLPTTALPTSTLSPTKPPAPTPTLTPFS